MKAAIKESTLSTLTKKDFLIVIGGSNNVAGVDNTIMADT